MNPDLSQGPVPAADPAAPQVAAAPGAALASGWRILLLGVALVAVVAFVACGLLWQKLSGIQEHLARQSADAGAQALEARTLARQAQDQVRETAAKQAVADARLSEAMLQRGQLEELMQSLSRSRDENLVVDIESSIRLAQQQAQLTLSVEPLLAALKTAEQRVERAAQPRLAPLQRALARDAERIRAARLTDTPGLLARLDDLVRQIDDVPMLNAVGVAGGAGGRAAPEPLPEEWWWRALALVRAEAHKLLRVSRIDQPEAVLVAPEQSYFLRENLKLKLLNARMGLLARQLESVRADLAAASYALGRYFDPAARKTQVAANLLSQVQSEVKTVELPRVDDTLAALATAAAGR